MSGGSRADAELLRPAFDSALQTVNRKVRLPSDLRVRMVDDRAGERRGISGPTYEPRDRAVYFPWSFVESSRRQLDGDAPLRDAMVFTLYHELTHGLIDLLDVPVVGGEERAADSFAAILAIRSKGGGQQVPLGMATLLEARSRSERPPGAADYADDHELDGERAVDALCLVYGSDPRRYAGLVGKSLPKARADGCPFEYRQELRAWRRLLARWVTEQGGLGAKG
jgi:Putative metallopeptidase